MTIYYIVWTILTISVVFLKNIELLSYQFLSDIFHTMDLKLSCTSGQNFNLISPLWILAAIAFSVSLWDLLFNSPIISMTLQMNIYYLYLAAKVTLGVSHYCTCLYSSFLFIYTAFNQQYVNLPWDQLKLLPTMQEEATDTFNRSRSLSI